jgi:hypothetical protein
VLPATALAAPPSETAEDPALTEAKGLYKDGEVKFQTADYEEALTLWKRAFALLPEGDEHRAIRHALVYNIAEAHSRAYEVSRNPTHLRKAKILLENYRADHRALFGDESSAVKERSEVDDRIAELDKKIAASEAAGETAVPLVDGPSDTGFDTVQPLPPTEGPQAPPPKPLTPQKQWEADVRADPTLGPIWTKGTKQVTTGAVLTGVGGVIALISVASWAWSSYAFLPGVWYGIGGVTGVAAISMVVAGPILIGVGVSKRKTVLEAKPKPKASLTPMLGPDRFGIGFAGRF